MTKYNAMIASNRQFLDDLSYAPPSAPSPMHTSVYVVFVPPTIINYPLNPTTPDVAALSQSLISSAASTPPTPSFPCASLANSPAAPRPII